MAQYALLRALHDHPDASASELARLCFVTRQSLRDVLGGLRTAGLVALSDAPGRGRARALHLTPPGLRRLKDSHAAVEGIEAEMLHGIPSAGRNNSPPCSFAAPKTSKLCRTPDRYRCHQRNIPLRVKPGTGG